MLIPHPSKPFHNKNLGEVVFDSLHHSHVVHCGAGNRTWKVAFYCSVEGVGNYIDNFWGKQFRFHCINRICLCNNFGGGVITRSEIQANPLQDLGENR